MSMTRCARKLSIALAAVATLALGCMADDAWSARGGSRGGAKAGFAAGGASRAAFGFRRASPLPSSFAARPHRHGRAVIFVSAPFVFWAWPYGYYYAPPPYYYGPDYVARETLPPVYVEKFDGTPTPQTPDEIFCPSENAYYPDVQECPNGWQRIFRELYTAPPAGPG
jgi:hypothetical protein